MSKVSKDLWQIRHPFESARVKEEHKTLLFSGNGYLGVQASAPEEATGTFINGFFEERPIVYGEKAFGFPSDQQIMIPLIDLLSWSISLKKESTYEKLDISRGKIFLDMKEGLRIMEWSSETVDLTVREETFCSLSHPHLILHRIMLKGTGEYRLDRCIKRPVLNTAESSDPRKMEALGSELFRYSSSRMKDKTFILSETTKNSGLSYACALSIKEESRYSPGESTGAEDSVLLIQQNMNLDEKKIQYSTLHGAFYSGKENQTLEMQAEEDVHKSLIRGWESEKVKQKEMLGDFWKTADCRLENDPELTRAMRYANFGIIQSVSTVPGLCAAAKGLSSAGYNGHYFWDSDIYLQAALSTMDQERAKSLVQYRISHLDEARNRAEELSEEGALYPWRTIDGRECSAYFPAGTAQFHINADIAWGLREYLKNSTDKKILIEGGAEMLFETARFWAGFAVKVEDKGYCLHCVTGPDEYTALVNNNFYTNLMAREHLKFALMVQGELALKKPQEWDEISKKIQLKEDEIHRWKDMVEKFYIPREEGSSIFPQDDAFLEKEPWDWEKTSEEQRPLLLHYHPLKIYRHKVLKQADVVMGLLLQREYFSKEEIRDNYLYYDPLTSGDSSLSSAVQSVGAALAGEEEDALYHFYKNAYLDLEDRENNTENGIHLAAMAGVRMAFLYGFGAYEIKDGIPSFNPSFPAKWGSLEFTVLFKETRINLKYKADLETWTVTADQDIPILFKGKKIDLRQDEETVLS